ncbi:MAG: TAXI family TRAP transporter solute-binding subunit [Thermovenabulum sp.]|uniref:TAXI family TRAP transporter solute-binding subunit n=1 Tax=Thermovenabulum sp. TaxID=3100335 RepID=UPI003C7BB574
MFKKTIALITIALLLTAALAGCAGKGGGQQAGGQKFITIATGGTAGTYFPLGGALADIWNKNIKGVNATAQSTGASVANVNLLKDGKADVIFVQNDIAYYAANGMEMFKDNKYEDIKGLTTLYPETIQIVTLADKNIKSVADLKGKKVAVGAAGSGAEANARQILEAAGITYNDISVQYLSFAEAANNLKDGNIDAAFLTAGFPTAAVQDIAASKKIELVSLDDALVSKLMEKYPYYTKIVIPANTYSGVDHDVNTVAVKAMLAVSSKMDEDTAYNLVKTMYANLDRLKAAHKAGEQIKPETGKEGMSIPLHPGAEKYFKEIGK